MLRSSRGFRVVSSNGMALSYCYALADNDPARSAAPNSLTIAEARAVAHVRSAPRLVHVFDQLGLAAAQLVAQRIAARGVGLAKAALDDSLRYAQVRKTFGKPIGQHQAIQLKLAEMATRCEAARLLTEAAARAYDRGERCDMEAGMAKYFATEAAFENAHEAMRIHGGYGYSKEFAVERLYRDAPLLCIGEGTNEMQRIIIARQLIERNRI